MAKDGEYPDEAAPPGKRARTSVSVLPVAILTGYLGAGKTTLLNYVLRQQRDKKLAVIENEVGEVSVDDQLVEHKHQGSEPEELVVLENGCVCCTMRGELARTLEDLAAKHASGYHLDGVIIELTGAADPAPVVQTLMGDPDIQDAFYVDNVIALVDAKHALDKLDEGRDDPNQKGTACAQIAFASTVLLNKVDLVDAAHLELVEKRVRSLNRVVEVIRCEQAQVPLDKLVNVRAFDLSRVLEEQYMDEEEFSTFYKPKMDNSISNVGVRFEGAINPNAFEMFLAKYLESEETAKDFMRVKGVLNVITSDHMYVIQCVHMVKNESMHHPWPTGQKRENRMIFIGRGMEQRRRELTEGVLACVAQPLRFKVGEAVKAKTGEGPEDWTPGTVLGHWDEYSPYLVKLQDGSEVHVPVDSNDFVMAP